MKIEMPETILLDKNHVRPEAEDGYDILRSFMATKVYVNDEQFELFKKFFIPRTLKKNEAILREGEVCKYGIFVAKGCLRLYSVDSAGEEHIVQFAMGNSENPWITDQKSFLTGKPSAYNIDALEDSEVLLIDNASRQILFRQIPDLVHHVSVQILKMNADLQFRITTFLTMSAEEKYLYMMETQPHIMQRVSQRHIASYLGIAPESLSRIRKRISENK